MSSSLTAADPFSECYGKYKGRNYKASQKPERAEKRITKCPECESKNLEQDYERAQIFCADCGFVITENIINTGPEWRAFDPEQLTKKTRVGPPMTYRIHNKGLGTIPPPGLVRTKRSRGSNSKELVSIFVLLEIDRMASALGLTKDIREQAGFLYKNAKGRSEENGKSLKGRSIEEMVSAILYIACRQYGVPRTLKEIAEVSRVEIKRIIRTRRFLSREFGWKVPFFSPSDFVPRFCSKLGLSVSVRLNAINIIGKTETEIGNGEPPGIAGAAIYTAAILNAMHRTQEEIAEVAGVTEVTIRNKYKEMSEILKASSVNILEKDKKNGSLLI